MAAKNVGGCENIKGIVAPKIGPKTFATSEKQVESRYVTHTLESRLLSESKVHEEELIAREYTGILKYLLAKCFSSHPTRST